MQNNEVLTEAGAPGLIVRQRACKALADSFKSRRLVYIEAQAGQGKTTVAGQYFEQYGARPLWYSLTKAETDPLIFAERLFQSLYQRFPSVKQPALAEMLEKGEITAAEYPKVADMLGNTINRAGAGVAPLYLVLDDVYLLSAADSTRFFVSSLIRKTSDAVKWLLISREPIAPLLDIEDMQAGVLSNEDLAFTAPEIAHFYTDAFHLPLKRSDIQHVQSLTEGWAMGLAMLASSLASRHKPNESMQASMGHLKAGQLLAYFRDQLLTNLEPALRQELFALALLDNMPEPLAAIIAPNVDLTALQQQNFFIRRVDDGHNGFAFHHLFHESLRESAIEALTFEQQQTVFFQAAAWYEKRGDNEAALAYLLRSEDYEVADNLAARVGLALLAKNRLITLKRLLQTLPDKVIFQHPWLSYLLAVSLLSDQPLQAKTYLQQAKKQFREKGVGPGELLAIAQLCFFHMTVDGDYQQLPALTPRAEELFKRYSDELSVIMRVQCAHYIGFSILQDQELETAHEYSSYALSLARQHKLDNMVASLNCNQAYESAFCGDFSGFARQCDIASGLVANPRVTEFNKTLLYLLQANYLCVAGDLFNYRVRRQLLMRDEKSVVTDSICRPFIWLWDIDAAVVEGRFAEALAVIESALASDAAAASAHMAAQYRQYKAYIAAISGDKQTAEIEAHQSLALRQQAGQLFHTNVNHLLVGATYARLGQSAPALKHLGEVLEYEQKQHDPHLAAVAFFQLAWVHYQNNHQQKMLEALQQGLQRMRENGYRQFFSWEPLFFGVLLKEAVKNNIEKEYARSLAFQKLDMCIDHNGRGIALLDIKTLGGFSMSVSGEVKVRQSDLSPLHNSLMGLLASSPQGSVCFDKILLALWPDVEPAKGRARLDTHIARLRKTLAELLGNVDINDYIVVENKHLCLVNARVDAQVFVARAEKGIELAEKKCWFQAANQLRAAHDLWRGDFLPSTTTASDFAARLSVLRINALMAFAEVLAVPGELDEAIDTLEAALSYDPTHEMLVEQLYDLLCKTGRPARASRLLKQYQKNLVNEGYTDTEVADLMEAFWH